MRYATVVVQRVLTRLYADSNRRRAAQTSGATWLRALRDDIGSPLWWVLARFLTVTLIAIHVQGSESRPAQPRRLTVNGRARQAMLAGPRHEHLPGAHAIAPGAHRVTPGAHRIAPVPAAPLAGPLPASEQIAARQPPTAVIAGPFPAQAISAGAWLARQRVVSVAVAMLVLVASVLAVGPVSSPAGGTGNVQWASGLASEGGLDRSDAIGDTGNVVGPGTEVRLSIGGPVSNAAFHALAPSGDIAAPDPAASGTDRVAIGTTDSASPQADSGLNSQDIEGFSDSPGSMTGGIVEEPLSAFDTDTPVEGPFLSDGTILKPIAVDTTAPDVRTKLTKYKVRKGDTLTSIAHHFGLSLVTLYWANHLTVHLKTKTDLRVGQTLSIPPVNGVLHIVTDKETITDISKRTGVSVKAIVNANNLDQATVYVGQWIIVPGAKSPPIPVPPPKPVAKPVSQPVTTSSGRNPRPVIRPHVTSSGGWVWPVPGGFISQYFHYGHWAIDIATDWGNRVLAAKSGVVIFAGWKNNGGGYQVWVSHGNNVYTTYNHMSSLTVGAGQSVAAGQQVGRVGMTGAATGPHCHFEVWIGPVWNGGYRVNPLNYV